MTMQTRSPESGLVSFMPRARLLKLIGAELISDDVVAITELVKNAHDADATLVSIQFSGVTGADGEIIVRDDGHGMNVDALLNRWMQPAGSLKGREGARFTDGGRRVLGEKGVGRFAADKLASNLELVSRGEGEDREVRAVFDWNEFDRDERMLSDVRNRWETRRPEWIESHGTVLRLSGLRTQWNERMFRRLSARLARLISPLGGPSRFRVSLESDEFPEYSGEVTTGFLDSAPYTIEADFDGASQVSIRLNGGKLLKQSWSTHRPLTCGPIRARLHAFDLETEALAKIGPRAEVRAWLREWSGVSVYRDGFRVWPYGEPHDDWLRLDQRRVNNPVVRLSNNQIVGVVEIAGDRNPELRDQTSREGLIHNEAFADLQQFALFAMQALEAERQSVRHPQGQRQDRRLARSATDPAVSAIPESLDRLAKKATGELANEIRRTATRARSQIAAQEVSKKRLLEGYSELAVLGHSASLVGRTVELGLSDLRDRMTILRSTLGKKRILELDQVVASVAEFEAAFDDVASRLTQFTSTYAGASKRRRGLDVASELERVNGLLQPVLTHAGASLEISARKGEVLRTEMRPEAFTAVLNALVRNSLEWAVGSRPLKIAVAVRAKGDELIMTIADNGKGVNASLEETLFEPMVSGTEGGAGMGLTLARQILVAHGGKISLIVDRRRKGATFEILLPRKRSRATAS